MTRELLDRSENSSLSLLKQAVREFKENSHTPEVVTQYWQTLWQVWGERADLSIAVPPCDRTVEEIEHLEKKGRKMVYVPEEVASQENRLLLGDMFPEMESHAVKKGNHVNNISNQGVWFDIEGSIDSPNTDTTEKDLASLFKEQGVRGQTLNIYIVGSQDAKLQTGHYFDENNNMSRLLSSRGGELVVSANFHVDGFLGVHLGMGPGGHDLVWGGRSAGSKKA